MQAMEGGNRPSYRSTKAASLTPPKTIWGQDDEEIAEAGPSSTCDSVSRKKMNPNLWSKLPQHIIDCIYARVSYPDFFRLRCVCKRWSSLIHSPTFLEDNPSAPFSEPWFLVITKQFVRYLIYDDNKSWVWIRLPGFIKKTWTIGSHSNGLLYAIRKEEGALKVGVFNPRTKLWKELPALARNEKQVHLHGMVTTTEGGERGYKLILVTNPEPSMRSENSSTQVYDSVSNSWALSRAAIPKGRNGRFSENTVCCNGALYAYNEQPNHDTTTSEPSLDGLLTLDLERNEWSCVAGLFPCETPLFHVFGLSMSRPSLQHHGLFSWQGRIYAAAKNMRNIGRISFSIWELQEDSHAWKEVNQMPWDHFNWISDEQDYPNYGMSGTLLVQHNSFQCQNLVLICGFLEDEDLPFKFVLYDLHKREWRRLDVPMLLNHAGCVDHSLDTSSTTDSSPTEEEEARLTSSTSTSGSCEEISSRGDTSDDTDADHEGPRDRVSGLHDNIVNDR